MGLLPVRWPWLLERHKHHPSAATPEKVSEEILHNTDAGGDSTQYHQGDWHPVVASVAVGTDSSDDTVGKQEVPVQGRCGYFCHLWGRANYRC